MYLERQEILYIAVVPKPFLGTHVVEMKNIMTQTQPTWLINCKNMNIPEQFHRRLHHLINLLLHEYKNAVSQSQQKVTGRVYLL